MPNILFDIFVNDFQQEPIRSNFYRYQAPCLHNIYRETISMSRMDQIRNDVVLIYRVTVEAGNKDISIVYVK